MKTILRTLGPLALWPLLLAPVSAAINPTAVSADAKWVVYADINALRESTLGKEIIARAQKEMQPAPNSPLLFDVQRLFESISNVTAYGTNFSPRTNVIDGALVIEGTGTLRTIAEGWAAQATLQPNQHVVEVKDLPFPAYLLDKQLYVAFPPEPIIVISKSKTQVVSARDVFRGQAPSLAQNPSSPLAQLISGAGRAFGVAASVVPTDQVFGPDAPPTRLLQLINSGLFTLGEENQQTQFGARLIARSDSDAEKLLKIVQGMTAMLSLSEANDRALADFLKSAVVERQGTTVSVRLAYASERLVQMLESMRPSQPQQGPQGAQMAAYRERAERNFGRKLVEWKLDKAPAQSSGPGPQSVAEYSIENVQLATGATVTISALRAQVGHGGHAMLDSVEVLAQPGGVATLRFEAENMRIQGYIPRNAPFASGGRMIGARSPIASAQFEFPGATGTYTIRVRYIEESAGTTTLAVHVKDAPAPQATATK